MLKMVSFNYSYAIHSNIYCSNTKIRLNRLWNEIRYFPDLNLIICNHWLIFDRIESIQERLCNQHRQWWSSDCMLSQNDYYRFTFNYHRRYTSVYSFPTLVLRKKRRAVAYCKRNITSNNDTNLEVMIRIILM